MPCGRGRWPNDFSLLAPALEHIIQLRLEQAQQLKAAEPVERSPWEILAQTEPDISKQRQVLLDPLRQRPPTGACRPLMLQPWSCLESLQEQLSADLPRAGA